MATRQDYTVENIQLVMRVRNIKAAELAKRVGISRTALYSYFVNGEKRVRLNIDLIDAIAEALNVPIGTIITRNQAEILAWLAENPLPPGDNPLSALWADPSELVDVNG